MRHGWSRRQYLIPQTAPEHTVTTACRQCQPSTEHRVELMNTAWDSSSELDIAADRSRVRVFRVSLLHQGRPLRGRLPAVSCGRASSAGHAAWRPVPALRAATERKAGGREPRRGRRTSNHRFTRAPDEPNTARAVLAGRAGQQDGGDSGTGAAVRWVVPGKPPSRRPPRGLSRRGEGASLAPSATVTHAGCTLPTT